MDRRDFLKNTLMLSSSALGYGFLMRPVLSASTGREVLLRPPGALDEPEFLSKCIQCLRCVDACPNHAIVTQPTSHKERIQSTPVIKPRRQACMLCNKVQGNYLKCTEACPTGALKKTEKTPENILLAVKMGTAEIDKSLCYSYNNYICGTCYRACPFPGKAMTLGMWEKPEINEKVCVGCGLCERSCILYPQAIRVKPRTKA